MPEWIKTISDMHLFDQGWNTLRDRILANQKKLGVIPTDAKPTPWPDDLLKAWDKLRSLQEQFRIEGEKYQVVPLDASAATRFIRPRPGLSAGRTEFTWSGEMIGTPNGDAPSILNTSCIFTAEEEIPAGGADDRDCQIPFRFAGKLAKLTLKVAPPVLTEED
jgi:hypothetical protein